MAHARGVFREVDAPQGQVVFKVFNCCGRRISRNEVPEDLADAAMFEAVERWLDRQCPAGHAGPCPSGEPVRLAFDVHRTIEVSVEPSGSRRSGPHLPLLRLESSA